MVSSSASYYQIHGWRDLQYDPYEEPKGRAILAVINPKSGSGKAIRAFKSIVEPEWRKQGIPYRILITEGAGHSTELLEEDKNIQRFESIVAIGGDGTLAEIIQGVKNNYITKNAPQKPFLGIIPVGSGNGLFKSLHPKLREKNSVLEVAKIVASSYSRQMDLMEVTQSGVKKYAFLALTLGAIADADVWSERFRCLGDFRFTLGGLWSLWRKKVYEVDLSYSENDSEPLNSPNWSHITGKFSLLMISNTSHCAADVCVAPDAKVDDGYLHIAAVKTVSTFAMFKLLLGLESGSWVQHPSVIKFKARSLKMDIGSKDAVVTLDGERISVDSLECRIQKMLSIYWLHEIIEEPDLQVPMMWFFYFFYLMVLVLIYF